MPNTPVHDLPYPDQVAAGPGPDVPADIKALTDALDSRLTPYSQGAGTPASLAIPAGKAGRRHLDTSTGDLYLDIGSAWVLEFDYEADAGNGIEINGRSIAVRLFGSTPGSGLGFFNGQLFVVDDGVTLERAANALRVKDGGITAAKLSNALKPSTGAAAAAEAVRALGTVAGTAAAGNDARFTGATGADLRGNLPNPYVMGEVDTGRLDGSEWVLNGQRRTRDVFLPSPRVNGGGGNMLPLRRCWMRNLSSANQHMFTPFYFSRDSINWNAAGPIRLRIWRMGEGSDGYSEVIIYGGYATVPAMKVLATGPNALVPTIGAPQVVSGTITRHQVFFSLPVYTSVLIEITYSFTEHPTIGFTAGGQILFDGTESDAGAGTSVYGDDSLPRTALPTTNLWNGREVLIQTAAMAPLGLVWRFRYNASSASAYKWEFVGGTPWVSQPITSFESLAINSNTWAGISGNDPTITLPLSGDFWVRNNAQLGNNTGPTKVWMGTRIAGVDPAVLTDNTAVGTINATGDSQSLSHQQRINGLGAGTILAQRYRHTGPTSPGTVTRVGGASMELVPIRCS